ncbi:AAA family ATPase [Schlesneria paludicola]|uniref:AAA family ATPase n=1 Tax=Schlesneria paludicola TaxID=360056 RepID=UPI00029B0862|nr:AAA family ATPase [Schlesneria paludicola]
MEAVIFIGIQGSGKSSFFKERFFTTHVRISLDLLKTRNRERRMLDLCLETGQRFVVDNTSPTRAERAPYIQAATEAKYSVVAYYFQSQVDDCLQRNQQRPKAERVPDVAIFATAKKLERPTLTEGFTKLYYVRLEAGQFVVEEWHDEI